MKLFNIFKLSIIFKDEKLFVEEDISIIDEKMIFELR